MRSMISLICSAEYFGKFIEVFILKLTARTPQLNWTKKPQQGAEGLWGWGFLIRRSPLRPASPTRCSLFVVKVDITFSGRFNRQRTCLAPNGGYEAHHNV